MMARNVEIVLGAWLDKPVCYVIAWTPGGRETGGTAQGMRIAKACGVPVMNLANEAGMDFAQTVVQKARRLCRLAVL
jgi:hypothetical protein